MLKLIAKSFVILTLVISPVFAEDDDTLSMFHQQGDIDYPEPLGQESYFAQKAAMLSRSANKYFGLNFGAAVTPLSPGVIVDGIAGVGTKKTVLSGAFGMFGGYGTNFNHFYLAAELSAYYNLLSKVVTDTANNTRVELSVRQPLVIGFDLIPGYLTESKNVLLYGRLGLGFSLIKLGYTDVTSAITAKTPNDKTNKYSFGLRTGVGLEYFFSDNFSLRTEYIYSAYNKVAQDFISGSKTYTCRIDSTAAHQINLGMSIHF